MRLCDTGSMTTIPIATEQWQKLYGFLRAHPNVYAGKEEECRRFIEGVYWILDAGTQWRKLPEQYGKWNSVYKRFATRPLGRTRDLGGKLCPFCPRS